MKVRRLLGKQTRRRWGGVFLSTANLYHPSLGCRKHPEYALTTINGEHEEGRWVPCNKEGLVFVNGRPTSVHIKRWWPEQMLPNHCSGRTVSTPAGCQSTLQVGGSTHIWISCRVLSGLTGPISTCGPISMQICPPVCE